MCSLVGFAAGGVVYIQVLPPECGDRDALGSLRPWRISKTVLSILKSGPTSLHKWMHTASLTASHRFESGTPRAPAGMCEEQFDLLLGRRITLRPCNSSPRQRVYGDPVPARGADVCPLSLRQALPSGALSSSASACSGRCPRRRWWAAPPEWRLPAGP